MRIRRCRGEEYNNENDAKMRHKEDVEEIEMRVFIDKKKKKRQK
jgi:hypothetical protein